MAAVGAPLGLLAVRFFGNFVNQELYGRVTDVPWAFIFSTAPDSQPRHPSQLYEAFLAVSYTHLTLPTIYSV